MNDDNRRLALTAELERAHEALDATVVLLRAGQPVSAVSRAYYAVFHAARALLFSRGLEPITHRGVRNQLALHFVRPGLIAAELGEAVSRMASLREDADYSGSAVVTPQAAEVAERTARNFVSATEKLLGTEGWVSSDPS